MKSTLLPYAVNLKASKKLSVSRISLQATMLIAGLCLSPSVAAQSQADVNTRVLTPITVTNGNDMNFGRVVPGDIVTIVRIDRNSGAADIIRGDSIHVGGTVQRAEFIITAEPSANVQITLPDRIDIIRDGGTENMRVNRFRLNNGGGSTVTRSIESDGSLTVFVSAQLRVFSGQTAGVYRGTYDVTVEYN